MLPGGAPESRHARKAGAPEEIIKRRRWLYVSARKAGVELGVAGVHVIQRCHDVSNLIVEAFTWTNSIVNTLPKLTEHTSLHPHLQYPLAMMELLCVVRTERK